jgi:response regulator RpfG family c-di-GMP phosphodiesterase
MTTTDSSLATILVVDDESGPRESLRMILTPGYNVECATSGTEALKLLAREPVDIVTLDLNMPGLGGQELMRAIHDEYPNVEIIVITGCGTLDSATEAIRYGICDYLQKPFDVVKVGGAVSRALSRRKARMGLLSFLEELGAVVGRDREAATILDEVQRSQKLRGRFSELVGDRAEENAAAAESEAGSLRTVEFLEVLAETIETKDRFMRGHCRRVAFYSSLLADRLALPADEQERVRLGAFLHDLGKVGVPTDLLLREGALDPSERAIVEQHPVIGSRLVKPLDLPTGVAPSIRHHHEWWDGTGYPDGLAGDEIPLAARVIAIADAFDAMSCDRPYRQALRREVVLAEFRRFAGVQFDPTLTKEFLAILESSANEVDVTLFAETASEEPAAAPAV